jgi:diguanylate cyclase (GGDEF)-like protein
VLVATWYAGIWAGVALSILSAAAWDIANRLAGEAFSHPFIPYWNEFSRLAVLLVVSTLLAKLQGALERERVLSRVDPLTGVANPRAFDEVAREELARARRHRRPLTVVFVDLDDFKQVNDRFGHGTGDAVLRAVADTLASSVRDTDRVARLGGDEFVVLLPETGCQAAAVAIGHLQAELGKAMEQSGWQVTFSLGARSYGEPPPSAEELIRAADELMYVAKQKGKSLLEHRCT